MSDDKMIELRNETDHEFVDISSELWRTYHFTTGDVRIDDPAWLSVSSSGGARILSMDGCCVYVPYGWLFLEWQVREGARHFVR